MKKSIVVSIWVATALLMGCRQEGPSGVHSGQLLQVDALIEDVAQGGSVGQSSRAVVSDAAWKIGSTFGLWVVPYKVTGSDATTDEAGALRIGNNYADNILHTFAGASASFTPATPIYYPTSEGKVDLYAVSPRAAYTNNTLSSTTAYPHSILANQTPTNGSAVISSDLMTGKGTGRVGGGATITFTHRMSKALIGFTLPAKYKNENVVVVKSVELVGVPLHTTINLTDASIAPVPTSDLTPTDIQAFQAEKPASDAAGKYVYEAIVVPGSVIASGASLVRIALEVENIVGDVVFNCKLTGTAHTFVAQQQTDINITIEDQTEITLDATKVTITPWGATATISGSTSKLSKMIFEYEDPTNLWESATTCDAATLVIEGETIQATKVQYVAGTPNQFVIEYDHGLNAGGYLEFITIKKTVGGITLFNNIGLKGLNGGKPRGYQIKGDPTLSSYSQKIGKITVTANGTATIAPIP